MSGFDDFDIIGFSILVVTLVIYATLFLVQTCYLNSEIYRIQVLSMRFAFFVIPAYTILFYVSVTASDTIFGMELIVAVLEAFAFWNLFAMIVSNLGGPVGMLKTINFLDTLPNHHLIRCMCLNGPQLYMRFVWALRLFSTVRVLLVFLFCVFSYTGDRQAAGLSNAASAVFVVYAFTNFLALYHRIASASDSIYAGTKFLIFKIVVLLVVLESLVNRFLPEGDKINLDPSGDSEGDERDLSLLFMIEFAVLLPLYIYAFGSKMTGMNASHVIHILSNFFQMARSC